MADAQPKTLRSFFASAEKARLDLETHPSTITSSYQENLASAITSYEECLKIAHQVSLFSPNESLEDINSSDLQYLLINFDIAELVQKRTGGGAAERKANLVEARRAYERFLKLLDNYDLLGKEDSKLWERYLDDPDRFEMAAGGDATKRREVKIARYKEEKELKRKLEYRRQNPTALQNDDAALRDLHLTNLSLSILQTFTSLESIALELRILTSAPPAPPPSTSPTDTRDQSRQTDPYSDRLDTPLSRLNALQGPILSPKGIPLRPFTLLDKRTQLQQGVFRPDHSLPTMSIDEYLAEEKRRGGMIDGGGEASARREVVDEDDLVKADEETMKQREWDEFKEANPKGSGNTINRG